MENTRQFTPENITELADNEIFVFGSNMNGNHAGGAARTAVEKFGAIMGQAEGIQGQSYAIPTLDRNMQKVTPEQLEASFERLAGYAKENTGKTFLLTKIGCGIAGFSEEEIISILNKVEMPENVIMPEDFNIIYAFKAFDKDMKCRGFQYEEGMEYQEDMAIVCKKGFHACRNPLDVLYYYPLVDDNGNMSRFASVEQSGTIDRSKRNKICSSRIRIKAELGFPGFIKACIEWIKDIISPETIKVDETSNLCSSSYDARIGSSGYGAQIGSSGDGAQIGSSGNDARIGSSGNYARIGSSGNGAQIGSSGNDARIGSSGNDAQIGSSGNDARIGSSGYGAQIGSSGNGAQIGSSGNYAQIGSSGNDAQIGSSGDGARIGSSGNDARIGSSGNDARIGSSGYGAQIGSSGNDARIESSGEDSVITCAGHGCKANAKIGSWITLSEWEWSDEKGRYVPKCVKTEYVDGERIKADTWYMLKNGEFKEVEE